MVALTTKALLASCLVIATGVYFNYLQDDPFEYFYLALQWPASLCDKTGSNKCSRPVPDYFTIHGLWAQKSNHESYNCPTPVDAFNYKMLKKDKVLMEMMNKSWPSLVLRPNPNRDFWRHEWEKHGICTFKSQQKEYFNKTCVMWEKAKLLEIFKEKNITPGNQYRLREYVEAIRTSSKLGVEPGTFQCEGNDQNKRLVEVKLCTDKKVTEFKNCSTAPEPGLAKPPTCGKVDDSIRIAFPIYNEDDEVVLM